MVKQRSGRLVKWLLALWVIGLGVVGGFALYSSHVYHTPSVTAPVNIVIAPHTRARDTLEQLYEANILPEPWRIGLPVVWHKIYRAFKAGEYEFAPGMSPAQVLEKIARGEVVVHKLTIPEGLTTAQIGALLRAEPLMSGELPPSIPEGSLFPDTVHFSRGESRGVIVGHMQTKMSEVLNALWVARAPNLPITTPEQAMVLASIVEKETGVASERAMVAAVYINRLAKGMKLQADPTVVYGVTQAGPLGRPLTSADLARDTPYNTYMHEGLPPGPICNPGRASIEAALHPAQSDALYFVATGNGGHHFSNTIAEHEKNVAAYRKTIRGEKQTAPPQAAPKPARKRK